MIRKENENIVILGGLKHTSTANTMHCSLITLKNMQEILRFNRESLVIDDNSFVDINTRVGVGWFVEDFSLEWVFDIMSDIIVGEGDNLVLREAVLFEDMVCVVDVSLVSVVGVGVGACD